MLKQLWIDTRVRLTALFRLGSLYDRASEETQAHLEMLEQRLMESGVSRNEARDEARRRFGNPTLAAEQAFDRWRYSILDTLGQDVRYGLRSLRNAPGFAMVAILTLALGIGANTALFSLLDAVLLRNLPVQEPERLVFVNTAGVNGRLNGAPPYPCFVRFRNEIQSFAGIAAFAADDLNFTVDGRPEQIFGQYVSGNYFSLLGVKPHLGRLLTAEDEQLNPPVAVISHRLWQGRFGGDAAILGKTILHNGRGLTIVGVSPPEFFGVQPGRAMDITAPITLESPRRLQDSSTWWFSAIARLKPGVSVTQARSETDGVFQSYMAGLNMAADFRSTGFDHMELPSASKGVDGLRRRFSKPLLVLMAIVGLVLLIGSANLANLFMARASARRKEFAVRVAIGAGRGRLIRQLLTETLLLFSTGAAAGLLVAHWSIRILTGFFAGGRSPIHLDAYIDLRVLAFTAAVTLLTGVLFGLMPALGAVGAGTHALLKESGSNVTASRGRVSARQFLVVAQIALSLVLLVGAGLFVRTLMNLTALNAGFRSENVLTMSVQPLGPEYQGPRMNALWNDLLIRVRTLPGVRSASLSRLTPLSGRDASQVSRIPGQEPRSFEDSLIHQNHVSDGYLETFGIALLRGRTLTSADLNSASNVAIINEATAKFYFSDRDPIGSTIEFGRGESRTVYRIAGVVADVKHQNLREETPRFAFLPMNSARFSLNRMTLSLKSEVDPTALIPAVRWQIEGLGPNILLSDVMTVEQQVDVALAQERLMSLLSLFFGILALLLSAIGLYGTLSQTVIQRTSEIGIRMALGAERRNVMWMILRRSLLVAGVGIATGIPVALLAVRPIETLLYGLKPTDAGSLILACAVLLAAALLASYLPARRASRIDPMIALRRE